jgi:S-adenosylmethionine-diacylglycerol 3-amino-3-carboxypropyl transferase
MGSEIGAKVDFSIIRYAQCWEDADILLAALDVQPHHTCLSIASAGDNCLAMLSCAPQQLIALDLSPAQLACLQLRVAAYSALEHAELLELVGARFSLRRAELYQRCRPLLATDARAYWDRQPATIGKGFGTTGRFEQYLRFFARWILPLLQPRWVREQLLVPRSPAERQQFYTDVWDNWRWRWAFRLFFSRRVMGRMGRDPIFFTYVKGDVGKHLLERTRYALTELDPSVNPYLHWILLGAYRHALPYALRPEHFDAIRAHLPRLEWRCQSIEEFVQSTPPQSIDRFNLSDIFEYLSPEQYHTLLGQLLHSGRPGGRLAYWNMLVPRRRPPHMAGQLRPMEDLARSLYNQDKAFFYSDFVVEEIV